MFCQHGSHFEFSSLFYKPNLEDLASQACAVLPEGAHRGLDCIFSMRSGTAA